MTTPSTTPTTTTTNDQRRVIYTIGHSTHTLDKFCALLVQHQIKRLVDIRRYPGSRRLPHFNQDALQDALYAHGIRYDHLEHLGGRRGEIVAGSDNDGWRVRAFRAFADYARYSSAFAHDLAYLERIARDGRTAYMCSEHTHLQCHRRIISDYLLARGWRVQHILANGLVLPHTYTSWARVEGVRVAYPCDHGAHDHQSRQPSLFDSAVETRP